MFTISATYIEEGNPLYIAQSFFLRDFDSSDSNSAALEVTVTMTHAVDGSEEGLFFNTEGTGIIVDTVFNLEQFYIKYVLRNASSYAEYQQVSQWGSEL